MHRQQTSLALFGGFGGFLKRLSGWSAFVTWLAHAFAGAGLDALPLAMDVDVEAVAWVRHQYPFLPPPFPPLLPFFMGFKNQRSQRTQKLLQRDPSKRFGCF